MQYNYKKFNSEIDKLISKHKIFFFYGENTFFMLDTVDKILARIEANKEIVYPWETNIDDIVRKLTTEDLFTRHSCIVFRYYNLAKKTLKKQVKDFLQSYEVTNYFFVLYESRLLEHEKLDENIKYFLEEYISVEFTNLTKDEVINEFIPKKIKFNLSDAAKEILYEKTNNDLWLLSNELEKLNYFAKDKTSITENEILSCCAEYDTAEVYQLTEGILSRDTKQNLKLLDELVNVKKVPEVYILNTLYWILKKKMWKKISEQKMCKLLQELQWTDFRLKTSPLKKYIIELCLIRITQILNE